LLTAAHDWLFRILYAGFAGLNEFLELSALSHSPKMFAVNICIQNPIEPHDSGSPLEIIGSNFPENIICPVGATLLPREDVAAVFICCTVTFYLS